MRQILTIFIWITLIAITSNGYGQSKIRVIAQPVDTAVWLRWMPQDMDTWKLGNAYGYSLLRYTTHTNSTRLSPSEIHLTKEVLAENLRPLSSEEWTSQFTNNDYADMANAMLYDLDTTTVVGGSATLADAVNQEESGEVRFLFALFAAEQDFDVAQGMALGVRDGGRTSTHQYLYILSIAPTDGRDTLYTSFAVDMQEPIVFPSPSDVVVEGFDQLAVIEWNQEELQGYYSSYDIERSTDSINFAPANEYPYVFATEAEELPKYAIFQDTLANNQSTYYYRVKGRTPFGTSGPPSNVYSVKGKAPRLQMELSIDDYTFSGGAVELTWNNFDDTFNDRIQGFNIYRSTESTRFFEKVNPTLLASTSRSFTDTGALSMAYYKVEAIDNNDYAYESYAALVQLPDSIPPAVPTGLVGKYITSDRVELTWDANEEEDLMGYRVFVANHLNGNYTQLTSAALTKPTFIYEAESDIILDSIFFRVLAADYHENYSEKSVPVTLERPDNIPPSQPVLYKVVPTPEGVQLGWRFSESEDIQRHEVERKAVSTPNWETVLVVSKEDEDIYHANLTPNDITSTCFVDSTQLYLQEYEYRMIAYDNSNNLSTSETIKIYPFDDGIRGNIDNFSVLLECIPVENIPQQEAYDILARIQADYERNSDVSLDSLQQLVAYNILSGDEFNTLSEQTPYDVYVFLNDRKLEIWDGLIVATVDLSWTYTELQQLKDFQIYRSAEGSAVMLYKTITVADLLSNDYLYTDEDVFEDRRYFYQVKARHTDGGVSEISDPKMVKVPKF